MSGPVNKIMKSDLTTKSLEELELITSTSEGKQERKYVFSNNY
jgi:hypothetical protein